MDRGTWLSTAHGVTKKDLVTISINYQQSKCPSEKFSQAPVIVKQDAKQEVIITK